MKIAPKQTILNYNLQTSSVTYGPPVIGRKVYLFSLYSVWVYIVPVWDKSIVQGEEITTHVPFWHVPCF